MSMDCINFGHNRVSSAVESAVDAVNAEITTTKTEINKLKNYVHVKHVHQLLLNKQRLRAYA